MRGSLHGRIQPRELLLEFVHRFIDLLAPDPKVESPHVDRVDHLIEILGPRHRNVRLAAECVRTGVYGIGVSRIGGVSRISRVSRACCRRALAGLDITAFHWW